MTFISQDHCCYHPKCVQWTAWAHSPWRRLDPSWTLCDSTEAGHCDYWQSQTNHPSVWAHMPVWEKHRSSKLGENKQVLSLCCRHHSTKMQSLLLRSVDQGIPQHEKPFHTQWIAQVCEIRHFKITVQVQHLCPLPDCLLPHLFVQGWAGVPGAPLSPSTSSDKEGNCLYVINLYILYFSPSGTNNLSWASTIILS